MLLAMSWYAIDGRKWFKGPRINVHFTHDGTEILEGQIADKTEGNEKTQEIKS